MERISRAEPLFREKAASRFDWRHPTCNGPGARLPCPLSSGLRDTRSRRNRAISAKAVGLPLARGWIGARRPNLLRDSLHDPSAIGGMPALVQGIHPQSREGKVFAGPARRSVTSALWLMRSSGSTHSRNLGRHPDSDTVRICLERSRPQHLRSRRRCRRQHDCETSSDAQRSVPEWLTLRARLWLREAHSNREWSKDEGGGRTP